jgi:peptide/nickel transport system substrate-binding protein
VREALEYAMPRQQIVNVVFGGNAQPWANILSAWSKPSGWISPNVKPLPYNLSKANQILDGLGFKRGSGGIREVPATTGQYPQGAHSMTYNVVVPGDLDFDGDRQFQIIQNSFAKVGVKINEVAGGDVSQAYDTITAANYMYTKNDMFTWYWHPYIDPAFNLSVVTKAQWGNNSDTGMDVPSYDSEWAQQNRLTDFKQRQALVWKMEEQLASYRPYIQLVNANLITANNDKWTGFYPALWSYCKCYYTSPHQTGS